MLFFVDGFVGLESKVSWSSDFVSNDCEALESAIGVVISISGLLGRV